MQKLNTADFQEFMIMLSRWGQQYTRNASRAETKSQVHIPNSLPPQVLTKTVWVMAAVEMRGVICTWFWGYKEAFSYLRRQWRRWLVTRWAEMLSMCMMDAAASELKTKHVAFMFSWRVRRKGEEQEIVEVRGDDRRYVCTRSYWAVPEIVSTKMAPFEDDWEGPAEADRKTGDKAACRRWSYLWRIRKRYSAESNFGAQRGSWVKVNQIGTVTEALMRSRQQNLAGYQVR